MLREFPCHECGGRHEAANLAEAEGRAFIPANTYDCPDMRTYVFHRRDGGDDTLRGVDPLHAVTRAGYSWPDARWTFRSYSEVPR